MQAVLCALGAGGTLVRHQGLDMQGLLDLRAAVERARVGRDQLQPIEDAHGIERGEHAQGALHVGVGNGVVVPVEARVGGFARLYLEALFGRERVLGQGEQVRLPAKTMRTLRARCSGQADRPPRPHQALAAFRSSVAEAARGERLAGEANRSQPALLPRPPPGGLEACGRPIPAAGVEMDRIAGALQHCAAIVVEHDPGHNIEPANAST
jgi:hypothetical protein